MHRALLTAGAVLLLSPLPGTAQSLSVAAEPAASPIVLDGVLDEPVWEYAGIISDLTQQDPEPGKPTPFDATRIFLLTDGVTLYIGIVCPDTEPEKIAVHTLQRDADMEGDDTVAVVLDTFGTTPSRATSASTPACAGRSGPAVTSSWSGTATGSAHSTRATGWSWIRIRSW